jgi:hypothetical protein
MRCFTLKETATAVPLEPAIGIVHPRLPTMGAVEEEGLGMLGSQVLEDALRKRVLGCWGARCSKMRYA